MKTQISKIPIFLALITFGTLFNMNSVQASDTFITIGTGGITGVYYPTGVAIAKMINKEKEKHKIRAIVESTAGSVFNIKAVMAGDIEFGMVQSDRQFQAMNGLAEWKESGPQTALRAVLSLYPEAVVLVADADSGIMHIRDLIGKRVNIGNLGSGHRQNAIDALKAVGIDYRNDIKVSSRKIQDAAKMLQEHTIDAFFYTVGHPSAALKDLTSGTQKIFIADITGIDDLLQRVPYYTKTTIPVQLYPGATNTHDIMTFGVKATLVTSAVIPDDIVYTVTKAIFENFEDFKKLHPAYNSLSRKDMLKGLSAPIHPGAMKYFKETGLQ